MNPAENPVQQAPLSPGERARLVPSLSTRGQLDEIERMRVHAARVWAMGKTVLRRGDLLSEGFCRELHKRMFGAIWRDAGQYRTTERSPGWEPSRIAEGVAMFLDDAEAWLRFGTYPVDEAAVRLHHRLAGLHPWSNGNGRHARLIADILVASQGEEPPTWGARLGEARARYVEAIRVAESGDFGPLVEFARG